MAGTHFKAPVTYNAVDGQTRVPNGSAFAGMPIGGIELLAKYFVKDFQFTNTTELPLATPAVGDAEGWTVGVTGTTPVATISDDLFPPHLIVTNSAGVADRWQGQYTAAAGAGEFFNLLADKIRYFKCGFAVGDANANAASVTENSVFLGFGITDTAVITGWSDYIGFFKFDDLGDVYFVAGKNSSSAGDQVAVLIDTLVAADAGSATAPTGGFNYYEFLAIGKTTVLVFVNGVHVTTVNSTTQLPDDEQLCPTIAITNGEAVAKTLFVSKFLLAAEL